MTETELLDKITARCGELKLMVYHPHDSRRDRRGFPDLVIVGKWVMFAELKSESGDPEPEQRRWGSRIRRAGAEWAVWRPRDWHSGVIEGTLNMMKPRP